ncbi:MAG: amino acid ABC transporter permease [Ruminococcaceae bacterium]|jgi:L-cystine transport system permease protein|nr:amino acid ABC transporter permease [Oscillospiraceae bacterium]
MNQLFDFDYMFRSFPEILRQAPVTLLISVGSMAIGLVIGLITALLKIYKIPVLSWIATFYVSFTRGTPLLVQIYLSYYGIPKILAFMNIGLNIGQVPSIVFIYVAYSLNVGAYLSESIRSAIQAIDKGQVEAAYSVGMSKVQSMFRIIIPQAVTIALPNFGNSFIGLMKDTSLAFIIGVVEIMAQAKIVGARSLRFFEVYINSAIIYWVICLIMERVLYWLEKKTRKHLET